MKFVISFLSTFVLQISSEKPIWEKLINYIVLYCIGCQYQKKLRGAVLKMRENVDKLSGDSNLHKSTAYHMMPVFEN